ncbi:formyltransferase family protein [Legionella sp. D16C41]|uniref:formyltransferase family protein n=1 Tax=Legionella sp. D16C41 TaxID=3402688 RepID=UPI003AF7C33E
MQPNNIIDTSTTKLNLAQRLFEIYKGTPRMAILMSGKGSNAETLLSQAYRYPNLNFVTICTDQKTSQARLISEKYELDYFCLEGKVTTHAQRESYFQQLGVYLRSLNIDTLIYAGFMKISPSFFVQEFPGINVHPADLTIKNEQGKPRYVGMHAIRDAINNGEVYLASTAHIVDSEVDCGMPVMISKKLSLNGRLTRDISLVHEQLKLSCEHLLYPCLLELLSRGALCVESLPYRWEDLEKNLKPNASHYFSTKLIAMQDATTPLDLAYLAQDYSAEVDFDFTTIEQVMEKVQEEFTELREAFTHRNDNFEHFIEEIGDCFFH